MNRKYAITFLLMIFTIVILIMNNQKNLSVIETNFEELYKIYIQAEEKDSEIEMLRNEIVVLQDKIKEKQNIIENIQAQTKINGYNFVCDYQNGMIGMGYNPNHVETYNDLKIIGYGKLNFDEHQVIDLSDNETATLNIEVSGTLYNFKLEYIKWNEDDSSYSVIEEICSYGEISNTDVLFNSVLSEGLPSELLTWRDEDGKEFNYLIGDNTLSGNAFPYIIISELFD